MTIIASPDSLELRADLTSAWSMSPLQSWAFLLLAGLAVWGVVQIVLAIEARSSSERSSVTGAAASPAADARMHTSPRAAQSHTMQPSPVSGVYDQDAPENQVPRLRALNPARTVVVPAEELELRRQARRARQEHEPRRRPVSQFFDQDVPEHR